MGSQLRSVSATTSWAALPSLPAKAVSILNGTGAALEIRKEAEDEAGELITLPDGRDVGIAVVANAAEIQIKAASGAAGVQLVIDQ